MANEIADGARALESAHAAEAQLRAQSAAAVEAHREEARAAAERVQELRSERDSLHGALEAARREAQSLRDELAVAHAAADEAGRAGGDALLRQAISDIGADVLRLTRALEREPEDGDADASSTPAERLQRLQKSAGRATSVA